MARESKGDRPKEDNGLDLSMSRRAFLGGAAGGLGIRVVKPVLAGLTLLGSAAAPQAALAGVPSGFRKFTADNAQNRGSALKSHSSIPSKWADPTFKHNKDAVRQFEPYGMSAAINADGRLGYNEFWFPGGDVAAEKQRAWVVGMAAGDEVTVTWERVGEYYGDPVGCRMWVGNAINSDRYNAWGWVNGDAGNVFESRLGARRFIIVPKQFGSGHYMLGIAAAYFTFEFFYTNDSAKKTISIDTGYVNTSSLMADAGGVEWCGPGEGWLGNAYIPDEDNNSTVTWGNWYGHDGAGGTSADSYAQNSAAFDFSGTKIGVWRGDTVGQIGYFMSLEPLQVFLYNRKYSKYAWNGWGADAPAVPNGVYRIYAKAADGTKKFLDVPSARGANGTKLQVWQFTEKMNRAQTWTCVNTGGHLKIHPATNMTLALDERGGKFKAQDKVQIYDNVSTEAQNWFPELSGSVNEGVEGVYLHVGSTDGLVMDIEWGKFDNGQGVQVYDKNGGAGQVWYFVPIDRKGENMVEETERFRAALEAPPTLDASKVAYSLYEDEAGNSPWKSLANIKPGEDKRIAMGYALWPRETATPDTHVKDTRVYRAMYGGHGAVYMDFADYPRLAKLRIKKRAAVKGPLIPNGVYRIRNKLGSYLDIPGDLGQSGWNMNAQVWQKGNDDVFVVYNLDDGTIKITPNRMLGCVLDAAGGKTANGTRVQTYFWNGSNAQRWVPEKHSEGYFVLKSALDRSKVIDTYNGSTANGAAVQLWDQNTGGGQRWAFEPVNGKTFDEYCDSIPDTFDDAAGTVGVKYGVFTDVACTKRLCELEKTDDSDVVVGEVDLWCGKPYFIRETESPANLQLDETVYGFYMGANADGAPYADGFEVGFVDVPSYVTVHFLYSGSDGKPVEVHSYRVRYGATVSSDDPDFSEADSALKSSLGAETLDYADRWWVGDKMKAGTEVRFDEATAAGDIYLWALVKYGEVVFYVDGGGDSNVVLVSGRRAHWRLPWGAKVAASINVDAVTEAARAPRCTPGLTAWYTDPTDPAVADDDLPAGVSTASGTGKATMRAASARVRKAAVAAGSSKWDPEGYILTSERLELYGVNRATLSFGYADGSEKPREGVVYRARPSESADVSDVSLPSPIVGRVGRSRALPARNRSFEPYAGSWRTFEPDAWHASPAADDPAAVAAVPNEDGERYILWRYTTADGIVDERA